MDARWRIQLFEGLRAVQGERVVTRFRTHKATALFAYLAYYRERRHPREYLIELLWPECDPEVGRHRLSVALSSLRGQLAPPGEAGSPTLLADHFSVGLDPARVTTDVAEFEAALQAAAAGNADERVAQLAVAADLYRGELLVGYYEDWVLPEKERMEEHYFSTLRQLIAELAGAGDTERALRYALRAVSVDPAREDIHRTVMSLYAAVEQPDAALRHYRNLERVWKERIGLLPTAATRALARQIEQVGTGRWTFRLGENELLAHPAPLPRPPSRTPPPLASVPAESPGGAVPLGSPFYIERHADEQLRAAITRRDSVVLLKGARQVGKTSLLARGLQQARRAGARVVMTDLQKLNAPDMASAEALCLALAETLAEQLDLDSVPGEVWHTHRGPSANLERYLRREVLGKIEAPVVWALDEVDLLFGCEFSSEIFRLFRAWHNERALDPAGPWMRFTLVIAYATEAHLFITNLNQSPFNVGTRLELEDFTREQVMELNRRHGSPLASEADLARLYRLLSGYPYLVRLALHEMTTRGPAIATIEAQAEEDGGLFSAHLQRLRILVLRDPALCEVLRGVLQGRPCPTPASFYRLRSAGVLVGDSPRHAQPRCRLYAAFLERHLLG